jgi:FlaA1/EpsC-like NDP-sugar epimerase
MYFFVFTVIGVEEIPRSIGILQPMSLFLLTGASRYFVRYWLGWSFVNEARYSRPKATALIYGAGSNGRQLNAALASSHEILVKGFVDDDLSLQGSTINNVPIYGGNKLSDLIQHLNITDIILAIPSAGQRRRSEIISSLSGYGVRVRTLPALFNMSSGQVSSSDMHELDMNDLLGRQVVPPNIDLLEKNIKNKVILVTGAGGSIGTELCHQIINLSPKSLVLVDSSEHALYLISQKLENIVGGQEYLDKNPDSNKTLPIKIFPYLASIRDRELITHIFANHRPETVFHAAAYKHVPLLEQNVSEGIRNNVYGTLICAQIARKFCVSNFVLISTDKAVRPTNVMGASKRLAEMVCQGLQEKNGTRFVMVRFGNVLGSSGSVIPQFREQIKIGGPLTVTHPEITRYFMSIPEAAQLVMQAGLMGKGSEIFILDMGEPIRILDLAKDMIITILTNASDFPDSLVEKFKKFKKVLYTVSIDGIGAVIEYQRRGARWATIVENVAKIQASPVHQVVNHVVTAVNILGAMDFVDWCYANNLKYTSISHVFQEHLGIAAVPPELKTIALERLTTGRKRYEHWATPAYSNHEKAHHHNIFRIEKAFRVNSRVSNKECHR